MNNIKRLFQILGKWKWYYVLSGVLLIFATFIRMFEPKVLQMTIDKLIVFFQTGGKVAYEPDDKITVFLYSVLPEFKVDNPEVILISLGVIFLIISLLRGIFSFSSSAITASSTEKATKNLRLRLFSHIQALPLAYHSRTPTGELVQRCTGDVETVRKFAATQVVEVIRMLALFSGAFIMMLSINVGYAFVAIFLVPVILVGTLLFF